MNNENVLELNYYDAAWALKEGFELIELGQKSDEKIVYCFRKCPALIECLREQKRLPNIEDYINSLVSLKRLFKQQLQENKIHVAPARAERG